MATKSRVGKQADSIFAPTTHVEKKIISKKIQEKPARETESKTVTKKPAERKTIKSTITLYIDQVAWIDRLSADILCASGNAIDRGSILRGIIAAVQESKFDISKVSNEKDVIDLVKRNLQK